MADSRESRSSSSPARIVAFGDSTTAPRGELVVYADLLRAELPARGVLAQVINSGVPMNNTDHGIGRLQGDVLSQGPDLVVVQFGLNDSAVDVSEGATEPRVPLQRYASNLRSIVRDIGPGRTILMTPNPMTWTDIIRGYYAQPPYRPEDPDGMNVVIPPYVETVRAIAAENDAPLVDVYEAFREHGRRSAGGMDELLLDGMHPNAAGHRLIADLLLPKVVAALA